MKKEILPILFIWLVVVGVALGWNIHEQRSSKQNLALQTARAFFEQVVITRSWNAGHGGVYVPVQGDVLPNEYLKTPNRDLTFNEQLTLTKINPAYMTRQIAEIAKRSEGGIQFHITSLKPIRPQNEAAEWEKDWLLSFEEGAKEQSRFYKAGEKSFFRYMAPLKVGKACLKCHESQGYSEGDIRGGISVTLPNFSKDIDLWLLVGYGIAATLGVCLILLGGRRLRRQQVDIVKANVNLEMEILERKQAYQQLKAATEEVKQLEGILPICMHCKEIRDDKGYWNKLENYIQSNSEASFSHSICDDCLEKHYPEEEGDKEIS